MTNEALTRAKELEADIKSLENNLQTWEKSCYLRDQVVLAIKYSSGQSGGEYVKNDYIDFDHLKLVTIAGIQKKLAAAKQELEAL